MSPTLPRQQPCLVIFQCRGPTGFFLDQKKKSLLPEFHRQHRLQAYLEKATQTMSHLYFFGWMRLNSYPLCFPCSFSFMCFVISGFEKRFWNDLFTTSCPATTVSLHQRKGGGSKKGTHLTTGSRDSVACGSNTGGKDLCRQDVSGQVGTGIQYEEPQNSKCPPDSARKAFASRISKSEIYLHLRFFFFGGGEAPLYNVKKKLS